MISRPYSIMEHTAETRHSINSPNMTIAKEKRQSPDSKPNSTDILYLLHPLIQSMNNGSQLSKLTITKQPR